MKKIATQIYNKIEYEHILLMLTFIQTFYTALIALKYNLNKSPYIIAPLIFILYFIPVIFSYIFKIIINDFLIQFQYKEKFALFLAHVFLFFLPMFIGVRSLSVSIIVMSFLLLLLLQKEINYFRVYFFNSLLFVNVILYNPKIDFLIPSVFIFLLSASMLFDYLTFKALSYNEKRKIQIRQLILLLFVFIFLPVVLTYAISIFIPEMKTLSIDDVLRKKYDFSDIGRQRNTTIARLLIESAILVVAVSVLIALLSWLQSKFQKRKIIPIHDMQMEITELEPMQYVEKSRKVFAVPSGIRSKIIHLYSLFIEDLNSAGMKKEPSSTPREYAHNLKEKSGDFSEDILVTTDIFEQARYGNDELSESDYNIFENRIKPLKEYFLEKFKKI